MIEARWELPTSWAWAGTGEIARIVGGGTPSTSDGGNFAENGIPWITPADLTGYQQTYIARGARDLSEEGYRSSGAQLMPAGSVLFSSRAPIGYCVISAKEISTNQGFKSLELRGGISPELVRYYLLGSKEYAESLSSGTTFKELSGARMATLAVPIPPLAEQRRIVARLDELTTRIAGARSELDRIPLLVGNYRRAFLAAAFSGRLTQTWREAADLPEAEEVKLGTLVTDIRYGTSQKCFLEPKGVAVLRIPNVSSGRIDLTKLKYAELSPQDLDRLRLAVGDVLVVRSNGSVDLVGRPALVTEAEAGLAYAGYLIRLRPNPDRVVPQYLTWMLEAPQTRQFIEIRARSTSGVHNVNAAELSAIGIPLPQLSEQHEVISRLEAAFAWINKIATEHAQASHLLPKLDEALFAKAFRGDLVPQDSNDEPASELLARIRAARVDAPKQKRGNSPRSETKPRVPREKAAMTKSRHDDDVRNKPYLSNLLKEIGKSASVEELFKRSSLPVTDFYKQLAWEVDAGHIRDDNKQLGAA